MRSSARQSDSISACSRSRPTCCRSSTNPNSSLAIRPNAPQTIANLRRPPPFPPTESSPQPLKLMSSTVLFLYQKVLTRPPPKPFRQSPRKYPRQRCQRGPPLMRPVPAPPPLRLKPPLTLNLPRQKVWSSIGPQSLTVIPLSLSER